MEVVLPRALRRARRGAQRSLHFLRLTVDRARQGGIAAAVGEAARCADRVLAGSARPHQIMREPIPPPGTVFDVVYAVGDWAGEPKRYRVFNIAEGLRLLGYAVHVISFDRLFDMIRYRWSSAVMVLFRAEYDRGGDIDQVLSYVRSSGGRILYDVDDLVFDERMADRMDGLRLMGPYERAHHIRSLSRRRRLLLACDRATVSTAPLARAVAALGRPATVIPNSLNRRQLHIAREIIQAAPRPSGMVRLGYFSGTRTHQRDFASCEPALLTMMARHPQLVLRIGGYLELGPQWQRFARRVEYTGFVEPDDLLRSIAACDINLAPLELGNPFCEAKSELKFFEAAIVGVPTIASATETFAAAIENGRDGFTAVDDDSWLEALEFLAASAAARRAIGAAARRRAIAHYSPAAVIPRAVEALALSCPANRQPAGRFEESSVFRNSREPFERVRSPA